MSAPAWRSLSKIGPGSRPGAVRGIAEEVAATIPVGDIDENADKGPADEQQLGVSGELRK